MRVLEIQIRRFRNLQDVHIRVPDDSNLICLVGENGSGKSSILELIYGVAAHVGEPLPVALRGGGVFQTSSDFSVLLEVDDQFYSGVVEQWNPRREDFSRLPEDFEAADQWDHDIRLTARNGGLLPIELPSIQHYRGHSAVVDATKQIIALRENEYQNRAVPGSLVLFQPNRIYGNVAGIDSSQSRGGTTIPGEVYRQTFAEIIRAHYQAGQQWERVGFDHLRRREPHKVPPPPQPFDPFGEWLTDIFPHICFGRVDDETLTVIFDVGGSDVPFGELSSGEQEAIVQSLMVRSLPNSVSLMLIDEPELRLHPELLRRQLAALRDAIGSGQVWAATHSFEAAELAGPEATFVLTRSEDRRVSSCFRWADRPGFEVLARVLGMPAFSISAQPFVAIESIDSRERDLIERLVGIRGPSAPRFLAVGGKDTVAALVRSVRPLVSDAAGRLRIGGIVDRDHNEGPTLEGFSEAEIHVLGCHDIESLFLHPSALDSLQPTPRRSKERIRTLLGEASDRFAGIWIVERTQANYKVPREWFDLGSAKGRDWLWWSATNDEILKTLVRPNTVVPIEPLNSFVLAITISVDAYRELRESNDLWRLCPGKEVLGQVAGVLGFTSKREVIDRVIDLWESGAVERPAALLNLRAYVASL